MERVLYYILIVLGAIVVSVGWAGGFRYFCGDLVSAWIERKEDKRRLEREVAYLSERITELEERGGFHCAQHGADADGDLGCVSQYDLGEQSQTDAR